MTHVTLTGNVGADVQVKSASNGTFVGHFSVCSNEKIKSGNEAITVPTWFRISYFSRTENGVYDFLKKGAKVLVMGKLSVEVFKNEQTGKEITNLNVLAGEIQVLEFVNNSSNAPADKTHTAPITEDDLL